MKKQTEKFRRNQRVIFENPLYLETDLVAISSKHCLGHIKDFDGEYVIIQRDFDKKEFYVPELKVHRIVKYEKGVEGCNYLNAKALKWEARKNDNKN